MSGGLGISSRLALGRRGSAAAPWVASVLLTGAAFTAAQLEPGVPGGKNPISNANRIYLAASNGSSLPGGSFWVGIIKATEAKLIVDNNSATYPNAVLVSIDNGAFVAAANTGHEYTLFTGLADTEHQVCIRTGTAWGIDNLYLNKAGGNIMNLLGTDTYVRMPNSGDWVYPGVTNSLAVCAGMTEANTANYTPSRTKTGAGYTGSSDNGTAKIRGQFKGIWVGHNGNNEKFTKVWISVDGAAPTATTITDPGTGGQCVYVGGLDDTAVHTYYCWTDKPKSTGMMCVAGDGPHVDCGSKAMIFQPGDSITYGGGPVPVPGAVDLHRIAAALGFVSLTAGIPGHTVEQIDTEVAAYLPDLTVTSSDVAILAAGRNNTGALWTGATTTAYQSLISQLVAKGFGKVICKGLLPAGDRSTLWPTENATIAGIVAGVGNPNVVFLDVSGCPAYSTQGDNVHPDTAGYATVGDYEFSLVQAILGL